MPRTNRTDSGPTLDQITAALANHAPTRLPDPPTPRERAAVALVLAGAPRDLHLCLIRRADRDGDPWSGHVALPGGRTDPADLDARAAAERETAEEVGVHLSNAVALGTLDEMPLGRDPATKAVLSAFAWHVGSPPPPLHPDPREVADAAWVPLGALWDPANVTTIDWPWQGTTWRFTGIRWRDAVLWGLTLRVLGHLGDLVGMPLPAAQPPPVERIH